MMGYPSDLTNDEWKKIKNYFTRTDPRGAVEIPDKRTIANAILYVVRGGIQWHMIPKDFPAWQTVWSEHLLD